jgi:hypothetical protein
MTPREALEKLRRLSTILEHVPYDDVMSLLKDSVRRIPLSIAKMPANTAIDRARKNEGENYIQTFMSSYPTLGINM